MWEIYPRGLAASCGRSFYVPIAAVAIILERLWTLQSSRVIPP